jgi:thermostable 8-oxoguanine DNA glycosylase
MSIFLSNIKPEDYIILDRHTISLIDQALIPHLQSSSNTPQLGVQNTHPVVNLASVVQALAIISEKNFTA